MTTDDTSYRPMVVLTAIVALVSLLDWFFDFHQASIVPRQVELAWKEILNGRLATAQFGTLLTTISYAFLHADAFHLLGNLLFFWIFGCVVLQICGVRWWLMIFILTAIGSALGQIMLNPGSTIPMIGASGTVTGFMGTYLGLTVQRERPYPHVWPMARPISPGQLAAVGVIGILMDLQGLQARLPGDNIAYAAHIGGFLSGILVSFVRRN